MATPYLRESLLSDSMLWLRVVKGGRAQDLQLDPRQTFEVGICFVSIALSPDGRHLGVVVVRNDRLRHEYSVDIESGRTLKDRATMAHLYQQIWRIDGLSEETFVALRDGSDEKILRIQAAYRRRVLECRWQ